MKAINMKDYNDEVIDPAWKFIRVYAKNYFINSTIVCACVWIYCLWCFIKGHYW